MDCGASECLKIRRTVPFAYSTNYLIDTVHGVILDVEATPAHRTSEVESTKVMVDRVEERFELKPERLIADMAYGSAPMLGWMVEEKAIEPHVPVWDKTERKDGTFQREEFAWNEAADEYRCPAGHALRCDRRTFKKEPAHPHHESRHDHLSGQPDRLRCLPNEDPLLSEHAVSQDRSQHP